MMQVAVELDRIGAALIGQAYSAPKTPVDAWRLPIAPALASVLSLASPPSATHLLSSRLFSFLLLEEEHNAERTRAARH